MALESSQMTVTTIALPVPFAVRVVNCYSARGRSADADRPRRGLGRDAWSSSRRRLPRAGSGSRTSSRSSSRTSTTTTSGSPTRCASAAAPTVVAHHLLSRVPRRSRRARWRLEDTYQADVMRLHGVPEAAIAELYEVSKEHRDLRRLGHRRLARSATAMSSTPAARRLLVGERPGHSPTDSIFVDRGRAARDRAATT